MPMQNRTVYFVPCKPGAAYISVIDTCLNECLFCIKRDGGFFYGSDLALSGRHPSVSQIMAEFAVADSGQRLKEVVFCGMGEPLLRYQCVLDVCREIRNLRGHNITIRVDTSPGRGTRVSISLPLAGPAPEAADRAEPRLTTTEVS